MKHVAVNVALWLIAIVATFFIVADRNVLTTLVPVHAMCMIGSVVTLRTAMKRGV